MSPLTFRNSDGSRGQLRVFTEQPPSGVNDTILYRYEDSTSSENNILGIQIENDVINPSLFDYTDPSAEIARSVVIREDGVHYVQSGGSPNIVNKYDATGTLLDTYSDSTINGADRDFTLAINTTTNNILFGKGFTYGPDSIVILDENLNVVNTVLPERRIYRTEYLPDGRIIVLADASSTVDKGIYVIDSGLNISGPYNDGQSIGFSDKFSVSTDGTKAYLLDGTTLKVYDTSNGATLNTVTEAKWAATRAESHHVTTDDTNLYIATRTNSGAEDELFVCDLLGNIQQIIDLRIPFNGIITPGEHELFNAIPVANNKLFIVFQSYGFSTDGSDESYIGLYDVSQGSLLDVKTLTGKLNREVNSINYNLRFNLA